MSDSDEIRRLEARAKGMLPGVAAICMFMLVVTMVNAFIAARNHRYGVLVICTLFVAGIFGLLRLKRWGWALVLGGCLTFSLSYFYIFATQHIFPYLVQALFALVFFLYLVRTEVRERLR
jgi:peptidoglycan/LPS O-acetylase OafA/YrhL